MAAVCWTGARTAANLTLEATLLRAGEGLVVVVTGGDRPHVGSVSLAEPRESLRGGETSATVSTLNRMGHKDDAIGNLFADVLARRTGLPCVATCGVHVDGLDASGIEQVLTLAQALLGDLLAALDGDKEESDGHSADL